MPAARPLSRRRRALFWLLAVLILAGGIELGCRVIERIENAAARRKNPYVEPVNPVPAFEIVEIDGKKMVKRTGFQPLMGSDQKPFPLERPKDGLRAFVLGGSAAAGWPYHRGDTNISALLERKLRKLYPRRSIEVINMGAGTYASHRVRLILDEVLRYQPDVLFLYNGNNELLEDLVFRPRMPPAPWDRSAAARLSYRVFVTRTTPVPRFDVKGYGERSQVSNWLSFAFAQASRYRTDPRQFQLLLEHYRFNIEAMISSAEKAKVPIFLVTCPVNLRDWTPNVSRHRDDLDPAERARFTALFREGFLAVERGEFARAIPPLRDAIAVDDEYAEAHFRLAEALRKTGQRSEAKKEYVRALERDGFPFRELPGFQAILRDIAAKRNVPLVDIIAPLEAVSGDGIPGLDVFTDYVHLTEEGQEIAAHAMLGALHARGLLPEVSDAAIDAARIAIERRFWPERDVFARNANYHAAVLQHQYDRLDALYQVAVDTFNRAAREDPSLAQECDERLHTYKTVHAAVVAYGKLLRAEKLGQLYATFTPEQAQAIYERYTDLVRWWTAESLSNEEFLRKVPSRYRPPN